MQESRGSTTMGITVFIPDGTLSIGQPTDWRSRTQAKLKALPAPKNGESACRSIKAEARDPRKSLSDRAQSSRKVGLRGPRRADASATLL